MAKKIKGAPVRARNVRPDRIDFRDLPFRPNVAVAPKPRWFPEFTLPVKDQEDTSACTGFSLSLVVEHLLRKAQREKAPTISPYMLYSMARRYDEFPGSKDEGWSLRGALKGWHKHGACADVLWKTGVDMPPAPKKAADDGWLDAVRRPLGAYYRIDRKQIADIHAALNEVGIVYASADTHKGWDAGANGGAGVGRAGPLRKRPTSFDDICVIPPDRGEGFWSKAERWWNERVERVLAEPGTEIWGEMKQNAEAISRDAKSGAVLLWSHFARSGLKKNNVRFHLVGHSAGSIVHSHIVDALAAKVTFESVNFLAPAVRLDAFDMLVRPHIADGTVRRYQRFHLTDKAGEDDPTCGPYKRSLLYLVSQSFEGGRQTPILGMQEYFDPYARKPKNATVHASPGATSTSTAHGGFDHDPATKQRVVEFIKGAAFAGRTFGKLRAFDLESGSCNTSIR